MVAILSIAKLADDAPLYLTYLSLIPLTKEYDDPKDQVLCHNDLALAHIVRTFPLCVVDWEYAALGNRYFDLAAAAQVNKLSTEESRQLAVHYAEITGLDEARVCERMRMFIPAVKLTNDLWWAAKAAQE